MSSEKREVTILSELFYPEETSTGYFLSGIAAGLAAGGVSTSVLCSRPSYRSRDLEVAEDETWEGVEIQRIYTPKGNPHQIIGRLRNFVGLTLAFRKALTRIDTHHLLVVTNPPSLPWLASAARVKVSGKKILLVHDLYPDVLIPAGILKRKGWIYRRLFRFQQRILNRFDQIIVLGRDMKKRVEERVDAGYGKVTIIPNWGDTDAIRMQSREGNTLRAAYGLEDRFLIQFSGNIGRTHGVEDLIALAGALSADPRFHFLVFGEGAARPELEKAIATGEITNMTLLDSCRREELALYLNACDLFFLSFRKGMEGISVPSRMYNAMAAGNPILAVAGEESELWKVVEEEQIGWRAEPGDITAMVEAIEQAAGHPEELQAMRVRARRVAETKYTRDKVVDLYKKLFDS